MCGMVGSMRIEEVERLARGKYVVVMYKYDDMKRESGSRRGHFFFLSTTSATVVIGGDSGGS